MHADATSSFTVSANRLAVFAAWLTVGVGVVVLVGWAFDIALLKSISPNWVSMKANTAACFILTGTALGLATRLRVTAEPPRDPRRAFFSRASSGVAGMIGLLTLGEYALGWNPGLDQWLFVEPAGTVGTSNPGRMAPETALCFVALAVALWLAAAPRMVLRNILLSAGIGLLVAALALAALLSYATPILGAYGWFGLTIMAMHTALLFTLLGVAILGVSWRSEVLPWSLNRNLTTAFLVCIALLTVIGLNTSRGQHQLKTIQQEIVHGEQVMGNTTHLMFQVLTTQAHARGYVITGEQRFLSSYRASATDSHALLETLRQSDPDQLLHPQLFDQIEASVTNLLDWFQQVVPARQAGLDDAQRNRMVLHGESLLDALNKTADQIEITHRQHLDALHSRADLVSRTSYTILVTGTLASLLIFLATIFRLNVIEGERRKTEEALTLLKLTLDQTHDCIFMFRPDDFRFIYVNEGAMQQVGYSRDEMLAMTPIDIKPAFTRERFIETLQPLQDGTQVSLTFETVHRHKDGHDTQVEIILQLVRIEGAEPRYVAVVRDITERKRAERELKRSNAELEQFSYSISHDMRQPLRMVTSYLQLLEKGLGNQLDAEKRQFFDFAIDGARRMDKMMLGLLDYSRVGRRGEPPTQVASRALLDQALRFLGPAIAEAQASVRVEGEWPTVTVSPDETLRLLQNLIGNAIKFRVDGRVPEVIVTSDTTDQEWRVRIADNGVGILPDQIGRLFQVFQRLQSRAAYEGTGIGLALCRKIVERHQGRIWAESAGEGQGSTFRFTIPLAPLEIP